MKWLNNCIKIYTVKKTQQNYNEDLNWIAIEFELFDYALDIKYNKKDKI